MIVDECHHLAAAAYEHSVKPMAARFWLGLTATPKRRDGLGDLATWQLGPIRHVIGVTSDSGTLLATDSTEAGPRRELHVHDTSFAFGEVDFSDPAALAEVQRALIADEDRNDQIVADILEALRRRRNCLVLTRRVAHVETLAQRLTSEGSGPSCSKEACQGANVEASLRNWPTPIPATRSWSSAPRRSLVRDSTCPPLTPCSSPDRSPSTASSSSARAAWSEAYEAKRLLKSTTTTTWRRPSWLLRCGAACPATGLSASKWLVNKE